MINLPLTRVPIGYAVVNGQRVEVLLDPEWAKYLNSLNTQVVVSSGVGTPGATGATGAAGASGAAGSAIALMDGADSSPEFIPGPPGSDGAQGAQGPAIFLEAQDSSPEFIPGPPGIDGVPGASGAPGAAIALLGNESETPDFVPGPQGIQGPQGIAGNDGTPGAAIALLGNEPETPDFFPGPQGVAGAGGAAGATGSAGPAINFLVPESDSQDMLQGLPPSGSVLRAMLGVDAKNWQFLGFATGATTTVGPIIWTGQFQQIMFEYLITGYNGGTPVGRALFGAASISTTAATNGNGLMEGGTPNATSVSVPGCPLATTLSAIGRQGWGFISGASGSLKQITIVGMNGTPAAGTSPVIFNGRSFFSDLGTNLLLQRLQLSVYDTLTATSLSAQTFNSGTFIRAWGRFND